MFCMGLQSASGQLAREGIGLNVSIIPSAPTIYKHLRPSSTVVRRVEGGIEVISRGTMPGSSLGLAAPMAAFYSMAAISRRRAGGPPGTVDEQHEADQPGDDELSGRQRHLPACLYRRQEDRQAALELARGDLALPGPDGQLYNQFHLDEPWDSEHNKKLSDTVIAVYRSPASRTKGNMTNYLTVRGDDTAFPGKDGIGHGRHHGWNVHYDHGRRGQRREGRALGEAGRLALRRQATEGGARGPVARQLQRRVLRRLGTLHFQRRSTRRRCAGCSTGTTASRWTRTSFDGSGTGQFRRLSTLFFSPRGNRSQSGDSPIFAGFAAKIGTVPVNGYSPGSVTKTS